ncbi:hypothetical protein ACNSOO_04655 [Aliarcobacter lanthieri]|uniref:hypothetical protein n=1 Tax=Aliarcobacter lanthieri TaxID=1355374 RepID=UPI003AAD2FE3
MEIGIEKVGDLWCVFKKENNIEQWLDKKQTWKTKWDKAGIKDYEKAKKLLIKLTKENECTTKQLCLEI